MLQPRHILLSCLFAAACHLSAGAPAPWIPLFDGKSLDGWQASEHAASWQVADGLLTGHGQRSHLFYTGPAGGHDFRNFELVAECKAGPAANSGIFFHTRYQDKGWPGQGYEVQINNTYNGTGNYRELKRTGSLYGVRNIYKSFVKDNAWCRIRIKVAGHRIRVWVDGFPTVDYLQPKHPVRAPNRKGRVLSHGTFALQAHDPGSRIAFRAIKVRLLPETVDPLAEGRASDQGYGAKENLLDRLASRNIPFIDYHIHLRGGVTVARALDRQAVTGINSGILKNIGRGWPIETDAQLREFLDSATGKPVFVGLQVNDRDWMNRHARALLSRLDYVLADTMIMPMPDDNGPPVKLWQPDKYTIKDPEAWMERYMRHNLKVLNEPATILANPTYLPPPVEKLHDKLWTEKRMRMVIQAAVDNHVALEINARSGLPRAPFIQLAKSMGAKFTFGTNNFLADPIDMTRCFEAIEKYGLTKKHLFVPMPKQ